MLKRLTYSDFDAMFDIMEQSFPIDEHRPRQEQYALLSKPCYRLYGSVDEAGELQGFFAVWELDLAVFIEHFAVSPAYRNGGLGGRMLDELTALYSIPLCLEVEPPDGALASRRIGFYERHGFCLNQYAYMQPPISKGRRAIPLLIMTYGRAIDRTGFEAIRNLLYRRVYKVEHDAF